MVENHDIVVLCYEDNREEVLEDFEGIVASLIPPYYEREKIIMLEEYHENKEPEIIGTTIVDGDLLISLAKGNEHRFKQLLFSNIIECLKMHSYPLENLIEVILDEKLQDWISEETVR